MRYKKALIITSMILTVACLGNRFGWPVAALASAVLAFVFYKFPSAGQSENGEPGHMVIPAIALLGVATNFPIYVTLASGVILVALSWLSFSEREVVEKNHTEL
jgi:hypothetical protein